VTSRPVVRVREWSETTPDTPGVGAHLRGVRLTVDDRELLAGLEGRARVRVTELRSGLAISTASHVGAVTLSGLRLVIVPKMRIEHLMRMVAYAFDLSDLVVTEAHNSYTAGEQGLVDLLGVSLLRAVERIARGGLLPMYQSRWEDLATPRGRLDMRHIAARPPRAILRCTYDDLTIDHELNQILAAGVRLASAIMQTNDLRLDLARAADRFLGDLSRRPLDGDRLRGVREGLDRRSSHYRNALTLITLIQQGARLADHTAVGELPLSSFTLDMNKVFERFLGRHLAAYRPVDVRVATQDHRTDVFSYLHNTGGWRQPAIRPDFVFRRRAEVIAIGDAKYKDRHEHPPDAAELYQLTAYGLAYAMPEPREVLLLHPLTGGDVDRATTLLFAPPGATHDVRIRLVGVPIDGILDGTVKRWWPLRAP